MAEKLATYEDLEERLHKIFGEESIFSPADVIDTLEMELSEPDKKHPVNARILTYEEANKWQEYKDLEEQGLLVRLPFKLCRLKKIYYFVEIDIEKDIMPEDIICEAIAEEFIIDRYDIVIKCITGVWSDYEYLLAKNMGKSVFLTREEAEKKLEEMKTNG